MNIYQIGDLHFGRTNASKELNNSYLPHPIHSKCIDTYEACLKLLEAAKQDPNEKLLLLTGDQFQDAKVHEIYHYFFKKFLLESLKVFNEVWCIPGNHDCNNTLNCSMDSYRAIQDPKFRMIMDKPQVLTLKNKTFFVIPYSPYLYNMTVKQFEVTILKWIGTDNSDYMVSHFWITGAVMDSDYTVRLSSALENSIFYKYKRVFLGHIHKHQSLKDKVLYAGSIIQNTRGEQNTEKGFIVYNLEADKWEFRKVPQKRKYIEVNYDDIEHYQFTKDDIYTIIVDLKSQKFSDFHTAKERIKFFTKDCFIAEPEYTDSSKKELSKKDQKDMESKHYSNDWGKLFTNYVEKLGDIPVKEDVLAKGLTIIGGCSGTP